MPASRKRSRRNTHTDVPVVERPEEAPSAADAVEQTSVSATESTPAPAVAASPVRQTAQTSGLSVGMSAWHKVLAVDGVVTRLPADEDFLHKNMVHFSYATIEKKKNVVKGRWCFDGELQPMRTSPRLSPQRSQVDKSVPMRRVGSEFARSTQKRAFEEVDVSLLVDDEEMVSFSKQGRPELAAHERARVQPQMYVNPERSGNSTKWGLLGKHKTAQTTVPIQERLNQFPNESLIEAPSTTGRVLFCQCCPKNLQNILGTIKTHVNSDRHKARLVKWNERKHGDESVLQFIHEYFKVHSREKEASVDQHLQLFRWRVVEACMAAGIPLSKIDALRLLFERSGKALTGSEHLSLFVPKLELFEFNRLKEEIKDQDICIIYDGTTRLGECTAVLMRWCSADFEICQRLVALRTVKKHMNADALGPFLIDLIGQMGVRSAKVVCTARDSCATNGKAECNIRPIIPRAVNMMCVSHTLSHTAEHVNLPVLKDFMIPWLGLVQHHPSAKSMWRERIGGSMKGFSNIRWFSREEVSIEIAENFGQLTDFVGDLLKDEIGDAHPKKLYEILSKQADTLRLELACNMDLKPLLTTCYALEGDGLAVLLAHRKIEGLICWGEELGNRPDSLPNVAAVLRSNVELKPGVKILEFFADAKPKPAWFKGA